MPLRKKPADQRKKEPAGSSAQGRDESQGEHVTYTCIALCTPQNKESEIHSFLSNTAS